MVTLTNVGTTYDFTAASQGLGIGILDFTGFTKIRMVLKVQKVGTGVQSWQLWNETDGTQIGAIDDSGAAGVKTLDQTFDVNLSGEKLVRIRCKSTVAGDDPLYLAGACRLKP